MRILILGFLLASSLLARADEKRATTKPLADGKFTRVLQLQGVTFHVDCPNKGSLNKLTILTEGLKLTTRPIVREIDGTVVNAEIADLNADGFPELYVFTASAGSGTYGDVIAYATNKNISLSEITYPALTEKAEEAQGYMGHDEFAIVENFLVRRFPIYKDGENNAEPSGTLRQLQYKLTDGEASRVLKLHKVIEINLAPPE